MALQPFLHYITVHELSLGFTDAQGLAPDLERSECCCSLFIRSPKLHCQKLLFPGFLIRGLQALGVVVTYCLPSWSHLFSFITAYQGWWDCTPAGLASIVAVKIWFKV